MCVEEPHCGQTQHEETADHHSCAVSCQCVCHGALILNTQTIVLSETVVPVIPVHVFSYDEPFLPTEFRPPIFLS